MGASYLFLSCSFVCIFLGLDAYVRKQHDNVGKPMFLSLIFNVIAMVTMALSSTGERVVSTAEALPQPKPDLDAVKRSEEVFGRMMYDLGHIKCNLEHMSRDLKVVSDYVAPTEQKVSEETPVDQSSDASPASDSSLPDAGL